MLDNPTATNCPCAPPKQKPAWIRDMALHTGLTRAYARAEQRKAHITRQLKASDPTHASRADAETGTVGVSSSLRKDVPAPVPCVRDQLMQEYAQLISFQKQRRIAIRKVEKRILTTQPQSYAQAVVLMEFMSRVVATRKRFNRRDVAVAMRECALTLARLSTPRAGRPPQKTSGNIIDFNAACQG